MNSDWLEAGLLGRVRRIAQPWPCWLVGGAVRDHLLGRPAYDLDLVTAAGDAPAAALAKSLPARLVPIGGDRFAATRLVGEDFVIDIWDCGELALDDELARRDLTVNAIAVDLKDGAYHDPHGGRRDLATRRLRATTDEVFAEDPLRILRLARLAAELEGFTVEPRTLELASASLPALPLVAAERRREEFRRSLGAGFPERALEVWTTVGFYPGLLGTRAPDAAMAASSAFERARTIEEQFSRLAVALGPGSDSDSDSSLHSGSQSPPNPDPATLRAALLLVAADADVQALVDGGYVSRREARDIALVLEHRQVPAELSAQRWLLHCAARAWPTALCFAAASDNETAPATVSDRLERCVDLVRGESRTLFDPPPLLRGDEIRDLLDLRSGPEIGLVSRRLRRRQIEGRLRDRDEATAWLLSEPRSSDAD